MNHYQRRRAREGSKKRDAWLPLSGPVCVLVALLAVIVLAPVFVLVALLLFIDVWLRKWRHKRR